MRDISARRVIESDRRKTVLDHLHTVHAGIAPYAIDQICCPKKGVSVGRWIGGQSDYVISYVYSLLDELQLPILEAARRRGAEIINLVTPATEEFFRSQTEVLPERESLVLQRLQEGFAYQDLAEELGLSVSRIRQIAHNGVRRFRRVAKLRLIEKTSYDRMQPPVVCGIFALEPPTYAALVAFQRAVEALHNTCCVDQFLVAEEHADDGYLYILKKLAGQYRKMELTVVSILKEDAEAERRALIDRFCPPCDTAELLCVDASSKEPVKFQIVREIMQRSDYGICSLTGNRFSHYVRKMLPEIPHLILLDINSNVRQTVCTYPENV